VQLSGSSILLPISPSRLSEDLSNMASLLFYPTLAITERTPLMSTLLPCMWLVHSLLFMQRLFFPTSQWRIPPSTRSILLAAL